MIKLGLSLIAAIIICCVIRIWVEFPRGGDDGMNDLI